MVFDNLFIFALKAVRFACRHQKYSQETVLTFTALRDFFCSTGIVLGKAGNGYAGDFVNSAVTALFTKPSVLWLPAVPWLWGFDWYNFCGMEKCPWTVDVSHWQ